MVIFFYVCCAKWWLLYSDCVCMYSYMFRCVPVYELAFDLLISVPCALNVFLLLQTWQEN